MKKILFILLVPLCFAGTAFADADCCRSSTAGKKSCCLQDKCDCGCTCGVGGACVCGKSCAGKCCGK